MVFRLPDPSDSAGLPSEKTQVREIRRCEGQSCWRWRATSARRPSSPRGTRDDLEALDHQTSAVAHRSRKIRPDLCRSDDVSLSSPPPPLRLNLPLRLTGATDGLGCIWSGCSADPIPQATASSRSQRLETDEQSRAPSNSSDEDDSSAPLSTGGSLGCRNSLPQVLAYSPPGGGDVQALLI
jgi:hypothetical protein